MLKYRAIKKYGHKLQPLLESKFGIKKYYTASEVRSTVYKSNFSPTYLPLGYILYLDNLELNKVLLKEFPEIDPIKYKQEIVNFLDKKGYQGAIRELNI